MNRNLSAVLILLACITGVLLGVLLRPQPTSPSPQYAQPPSAAPGATKAFQASARSSHEGVPRFEPVTPGLTDIETIPGRPGYDPRKFAGILAAREIFAQEPRSPHWAGRVESILTERVATEIAGIVPEASAFQVECRTTTCKIRWDAPEHLNRKVFQLLNVLYGGTMYSRGDGPNEIVNVYQGGSFKDATAENPDAVFTILSERRRRRLKGIQFLRERQNTNQYPDVAASEWPNQ